MSRVREQVNTLIVTELEKAGLTGIAPSHGDIFVALYAQDGCSMGELAGRIHRTKSTVTTLVGKLEQHGYVERRKDPDDARGTNVYLTPKAYAFRPVMDAISRRLNDVFLSRLSDEEADTLERLLRKMLHLV